MHFVLIHSFAGFAMETEEMLEIQIIKVEHYLTATFIMQEATSVILAF